MSDRHISVTAAPDSVMSFGAVKAAIEQFGVTAEPLHAPHLAQSLRLLYPLDDALAAAVRSGSTSLTDSATSAEQIRFFQHQRARRSFIKLARTVVERHGEVHVHIFDCHLLDEPSREFFAVSARICGWNVAMSFDASSDAHRHRPGSRERRLAQMLEGAILPDVDELCQMAFEYVNAGDAWTAVAIGRRLQDVEQSSRVWNLLALGHAMLDETLQAERYYDLWTSSGGALDTVKALYGKSMLYARHHPAGLRSLDVSERILADAYAVVQTLGDDERAADGVIFDEVFNRNGYALTLFRRGRVEEAMSTLRWGIATLTDTGEKIAIHRTVLMYNLAQCHKQIDDLSGAIEAYRDLLAVDPYMPEYHLEFAKCLAATGDFAAARGACLAAIALDDTLPSAWSLLGVYYGELDDHESAVDAHRRAAGLDPDTRSRQTDVAYHLVHLGRLSDAHALLADGNDGGPAADAERRASLLAEIHLRRDDPAAALSAIDAAMSRHPTSKVLIDNRDAIRDMMPCN